MGGGRSVGKRKKILLGTTKDKKSRRDVTRRRRRIGSIFDKMFSISASLDTYRQFGDVYISIVFFKNEYL